MPQTKAATHNLCLDMFQVVALQWFHNREGLKAILSRWEAPSHQSRAPSLGFYPTNKALESERLTYWKPWNNKENTNEESEAAAFVRPFANRSLLSSSQFVSSQKVATCFGDHVPFRLHKIIKRYAICRPTNPRLQLDCSWQHTFFFLQASILSRTSSKFSSWRVGSWHLLTQEISIWLNIESWLLTTSVHEMITAWTCTARCSSRRRRTTCGVGEHSWIGVHYRPKWVCRAKTEKTLQGCD